MKGARKHPLTEYGLDVNIRVMKLGKNQQWLINQIKENHPEIYVDTSLVHKVLTGRANSARLINAINEALGQQA